MYPAQKKLTLSLSILVGLVVLLLIVSLVSKTSKPTGLSSLPMLPLSPKGSNITWVFLTYNFKGNIKELVPTTQGMLLTLDTTDKKIPTFLLTTKTTLMGYDSSKKLYYKTNQSALKSQKTVTIVAIFDLSKSSWITRQVYIQ